MKHLCEHEIIFEWFCPPHELCDGRHNKCQMFYKTMIELSHTIKNLYLLWIC
jgi:hypothetical protein